MIEIDGSFGEGGGQILRTALGLSAYTMKGFKLFNIRKNRSNPGLSHQHKKCVEAMEELTGADVKGNDLSSMEITFIPHKLSKNDIKVDIGTAGSISLLLQSFFPIIPKIENNIRVEVIGGTDVKWSPPIDYLKNLTVSLLNKIGLDLSIKVKKRGYYPKGNGKVVCEANKSSLTSFSLNGERNINYIKGISFSSNLPNHVAKRQKESAFEKINEELNRSIDISIEVRRDNEAIGKGSGIVLWSDLSCGRVGGSSLGEPGKPAEKVGKECAKALIKELKKDGCVDRYLCDQLIPYLGLAENSEILATELTSHAKTNAWVVRKFLDKEINIRKMDENGSVLISS